jgi:hypothetical protein
MSLYAKRLTRKVHLAGGEGRRFDLGGADGLYARLHMLMPLLVRLTDSEVEAIDLVDSQISNAIVDIVGVVEEASPARLTIHQESPLPDLHVEPVYRDAQLCSRSWRGQHIGAVRPSGAWLIHLNAGGMPDSLNRDREDHLALAVGRTMPLARKDGGDLIVIHAGTREGEHAFAHFLSSRELGDEVDPALDRQLVHSPAAPNDPDRGVVMFAAVEHDLINQAPQQRLTWSIGGGCVAPDLREMAS